MEAAVAAPPDSKIWPGAPEVDAPVWMLTSPEDWVVAAPVMRSILPDTDLLLPVFNVMSPEVAEEAPVLIPMAPELAPAAVAIPTAPLEPVEEAPLDIETAPPVFFPDTNVVLVCDPANIWTLPPALEPPSWDPTLKVILPED